MVRILQDHLGQLRTVRGCSHESFRQAPRPTRDAHLNRRARAGRAERSSRRRRSERRRVLPLAASNGGARPREPVAVRRRGRSVCCGGPGRQWDAACGVDRTRSRHRDRCNDNPPRNGGLPPHPGPGAQIATGLPRTHGGPPTGTRPRPEPRQAAPHARGSTHLADARPRTAGVPPRTHEGRTAGVRPARRSTHHQLLAVAVFGRPARTALYPQSTAWASVPERPPHTQGVYPSHRGWSAPPERPPRTHGGLPVRPPVRCGTVCAAPHARG